MVDQDKRHIVVFRFRLSLQCQCEHLCCAFVYYCVMVPGTVVFNVGTLHVHFTDFSMNSNLE